MAEPESTSLVICDAGPLIHLDELGCPELLRDFPGVFVADAVWQEVARHRPTALRRRSVKLQRKVSLPEPSPELNELAQAFSLDAGEFETLQLLQESPNAILLTDDGTINAHPRPATGISRSRVEAPQCCRILICASWRG